MAAERKYLAEVALKNDQGYSVCTGYAISRSLVLTAGHLSDDPEIEGKEVKIRFAEGSRQWVSGHVVWRVFDVGKDAALVKLSNDMIGANNTKFGSIEGQESCAWSGGGFPSAGRNENIQATLADTVGVSGRIEGLGGQVSGLLDLTVEAGPTSPYQWRGLSGAPVFVGDKLVGVIAATPEAFGGSRLKATPIRELKKIPKFDELTKDVIDVNDLLTLSKKFQDRFNNWIGDDTISFEGPAAKMKMLQALLHLETLLQRKDTEKGKETEILILALYLQVLPPEIRKRRPIDAAFVDSSDLNIAWTIVLLAEVDQDAAQFRQKSQLGRVDLLVTLVRLADFLVFSAAYLNSVISGSDGAGIKSFIPRSCKVDIPAKGIVQYTLFLHPSDTQSKEELMKMMELTFALFCHQHRKTFSEYFIPIVRANTRIELLSDAEPMNPFVNQIREINDLLGEKIKPIYHLGTKFQDFLHGIKLSDILPLPYSSAVGEVHVQLPSHKDHHFLMRTMDATMILVPDQSGMVSVPSKMETGIVMYGWQIAKKGNPKDNILSSGQFTYLTPVQARDFQERLGNAKSSEDRLTVYFSFGLFNEVVSEIWRKKPNTVSSNELLILYRTINESMERMNRREGRLNIYRDTAISIYDELRRRI